MTDDVFKRIMNVGYGAYGQHDVGAVYISTARSGGKTAFLREWENYFKEREMNCNEKLKNYLCTRCKYKHNQMVPCASCDGVSCFVEQSRSKYKDGLDQYVDTQKYLQAGIDMLGEFYGVEKEKEMNNDLLKVKVTSVGIHGIDSRFRYPQMTIEADVIRMPNGVLTSRRDDFMRAIENHLNSRIYTSAIPKIKNVIFNEPATIVFWADGTKTVVKCQEGDVFDPEKGLTMAITKKALGNKGNYCNEIKKWTEPYYEEHDCGAETVTLRCETPGVFDSLAKAFDRFVNHMYEEESDGK